MKKNRLCCALFLLLIVPSLSAFAGPEQSGERIASLPSYASLSTYASFNDSFTQCLGHDGSYYWGAVFQTFAPVVYTPCRSQMLSDLDFLSKHNVRTIRLWPVLSTFAYDNTTQTWSSNFNSSIANLDAVLNRLAQDKMQAYLTLMTTPDCGDPPEISTNLGYYFNPSLINNQTTQNQFIQALQAFLARYKNNQAIYGYDLVNEMSLIFANPPSGTSQGYCNLPYDTADFTLTKALLTRMYTTAKSVDTLHQFTFSFDHLYAASSSLVNTMSSVVDFYDFHAYSNDPVAFYQNFTPYDKLVIHGEVGVYGTQYDQNGNDCEGTGTNAYRNILPAMSSYCQAIWLNNAQAFVQQARSHNIQALFFQLWPATKAFGIRLYHSNNTFAGYQLTSAGKYVLGLSSLASA